MQRIDGAQEYTLDAAQRGYATLLSELEELDGAVRPPLHLHLRCTFAAPPLHLRCTSAASAPASPRQVLRAFEAKAYGLVNGGAVRPAGSYHAPAQLH